MDGQEATTKENKIISLNLMITVTAHTRTMKFVFRDDDSRSVPPLDTKASALRLS
jgi:hypothetical protein